MRLGEKQMLTVVKKVDFGVYLGNEEQRVLLPKKQVPEGVEPGILWKYFYIKILQTDGSRRPTNLRSRWGN